MPNSSRSVTRARPSGPPSKPPLRLRSIRAMAPGGGASVTRWTMPTAWPASPSSSASRGAWSLARTTLACSPTQCSTPSTRRSVRPGGRTGSRQPNWSPLVRLLEANAMPSAAPASDCQVSSRVLAPWRWLFQSRDGRYADGQSFGRSPASTISAWRSSAWRHRKSAASARSPGSSRTRRVDGSRWSSPVFGATMRAQTSAASPAGSERPSTAFAPEAASPAKRSRSCASRSGRRAAMPAEALADDASRRRAAGGTRSRAGGRPHGRPRCCAGRWDRRRAGSRSRRRTARSGRAGAPTAGRRRRSRRVARTRPGRRPRSRACSRARRARRSAGRGRSGRPA